MELQRLVYTFNLRQEEQDGGLANLPQFLSRLAPAGRFSLRYVSRQPGKVDVALLVRLKGADEAALRSQAEKTLHEMHAYLDVNFKEYNFQPIMDYKNFLDPFPIAHVVEISRQAANITVATCEVHYRTPIGFSTPTGPGESQVKEVGNTEDFPYILPWITQPGSLRKLCETLALQPEPCMIDFSLTPFHSAGTTEVIHSLEMFLRRCEEYLQGKRPDDDELKSASLERETVFELRARMIREWLFAQTQLLMAPENSFLLRIRLASPARVPTDVVSALGNTLTTPVRVSAVNSPYLAGGFQISSIEDGGIFGVLTRLDDDTPGPGILPHLFDSHSANRALLLPTADDVTFPGFSVQVARVLDAPLALPGSGTLMGQAFIQNRPVDVRLMLDDHRRHVYAIGQTGTGKTTLIVKMAMENIKNGQGVAVLDPHGDLIEHILIRIPEERVDDVILLDPGDTDFPIGLNMLEWQTEDQRGFLVDEMLAMLQLLYLRDEIGPMFWHNVRYGLLLAMANRDDPGTLIEFPCLFSNQYFHKRWLKYVKDPLVLRFWEEEFPMTDYKREAYLQYVVSKFDPFITHPLMRNIIGQVKSGINFDSLINQGKILLVNLAKGKLGEMNSSLLGMIIIAKLYAAAMRRISMPIGERRDFFVYVDEFQNLATDTFAHILSEARKFRLNLMLCNQYMAQLGDKVMTAILGNVGSLAVFRVGLRDAELLKGYFTPALTKEALTDQPNHYAYMRLQVNGLLSPPFSMRTLLEPFPELEYQQRVRQQVIKQSRKRHGKPRRAVEEAIQLSIGMRDDEEEDYG